MAADVDDVVGHRTRCARNSLKYCHEGNIHLFPACKPLMFIIVDITETFPKTIQDNQYIQAITGHYFKIARAALAFKAAATHIAASFMKWVIGLSILARQRISPTTTEHNL